MPAISGSEKALMQNRAGIARAGATRAGYYTPNLVVLINGSDRSTSVDLTRGVRIDQAINDEPDTAIFSIVPSAAFTPSLGQSIVIGLGTSLNREFAGQINRIRLHRRKTKGGILVWTEFQCIDYQKLFDRRLITRTYEAQSASDIVADIIDTDTSGFTRVSVASGLPAVTLPPLINASPSAALRAVATLLGPGAGYRIDEFRDVHFWGTSGESGYYAPTNPTTLTNSGDQLLAFEHEGDHRQIRTRVIAEGRATKTLFQAPADDPVALTSYGIPVEYAWMFDPAGGVVRVGSWVLTYSLTHAVTGLQEPIWATVTADADPGDLTITVDDNAAFTSVAPSPGKVWATDDSGNFFVVGMPGLGGSTTLDAGPVTGYGAILQTIPTGSTVRMVDSIVGIVGVEVDIDAGTDITVRVVLDDSGEQTALGVIEGGDGIHEHLIADSEWNYLEATAAGQATLDAFSDADGLTAATWTTEDLNARPGTQQIINMASPNALSTTLLITRATVTFLPVKNLAPQRTCAASSLKLSKLLD